MSIKQVRSVLTSRRAGNMAVVVLLLVAVYFFGYRQMRFFRIPSSSMEPTLKRVDQIVTLAGDAYGRGDIVVLRDGEAAGSFLVKRIVGVAGDRISVVGGALYINGAYVSEPYILAPMAYQIADPVTVPEEHVFLLGDNRNNSNDSHDALESFPVADIVGRVIFIYYPYDRMGPVHSYPLRSHLAAK